MTLTPQMIELAKKHFFLTTTILDKVSDKADAEVDKLIADLKQIEDKLKEKDAILEKIKQLSNNLVHKINSLQYSPTKLDDDFTEVWNHFEQYKKNKLIALPVCSNLPEIPKTILDAVNFFKPDMIKDAQTLRILELSRTLLSMRIARATKAKAFHQRLNDHINVQFQILQNIQTQLKASNQYIDAALKSALAEEKEEQPGLPIAVQKQPAQSISHAVVNIQPAPSTPTRIISSKSGMQQNGSPSSLSAVPNPAAPESPLKLADSRNAMYGNNSAALQKERVERIRAERRLEREREKANPPKSKSPFCCGSAM